VRKGGGTGGVPQLVDGVFYFIFFGFSAARARARFREVVLHGTKDVENEFRVSEMYLGVWGSSRFVAESDLAFFGLAGPVTTAAITSPNYMYPASSAACCTVYA
jgi:hypothetical protein